MSAAKLREALSIVSDLQISTVRETPDTVPVNLVAGTCGKHNKAQIENALALAADACTTLAAQMESATQGYKNYAQSPAHYDEDCNPHHCEQTWHAAAARMQAKLDAAERYAKELAQEHYCDDCGGPLSYCGDMTPDGPSLDCMCCKWRNRLNTLEAELDAANERVKELEVKQNEYLGEVLKRTRFMEMEGYRRCDIPACNCDSWHGGNAYRRLVEIGDTLEEAGYSTNGTTILGALRTALATAERERELLRKEVRRMEEWLTPGTKVNVLSDRSPEARALVDTAGPSGATG